MMKAISGKNAVIAVLSAAVLGLGVTVAVDHLGGGTQKATLAAATVAPPSHPTTGHTPEWHGSLKPSAMELFGFITKDTGLTPQQIMGDIRAGQTLNQIAGAHAAQLQTDALALVKQELDKAAATGALSSPQEASLLADAKDAIAVLMSAKLGALAPAG
jgi:hypothetical protein